MDRQQTQVLQWGRRVRDFAMQYDVKSEVAALSTLRHELDDALEQLTAGAAAQDAITKQSLVQTSEIRRLRSVLRDTHLKPIVLMSRTMKLEINGSEITFVLPHFRINNERLAAAADAMVTSLETVGPLFVARGFAPNFVEQLGKASKALRAAIDQRAGQKARRSGTTAAMERDSTRVVQLVRVIDTLVRPVIRTDPELLAAWETVVALPQRSRRNEVVIAPAVLSAIRGESSLNCT